MDKKQVADITPTKSPTSQSSSTAPGKQVGKRNSLPNCSEIYDVQDVRPRGPEAVSRPVYIVPGQGSNVPGRVPTPGPKPVFLTENEITAYAEKDKNEVASFIAEKLTELKSVKASNEADKKEMLITSMKQMVDKLKSKENYQEIIRANIPLATMIQKVDELHSKMIEERIRKLTEESRNKSLPE